MKVSGVETGVRIYPQNPSFRSEITVPKETTVHDEFVSEGKKTKRKKLFLLTSSLIIAGLAAYLTHKAGWWEKSRDNVSRIIDENTVFKKPEEAKAYFESLGIKTEFRDVTDAHLSQLNRIKNDLKTLKELGVKKDKPETLTISDWKKADEYEQLCRQRGVSVERKENYYAFCAGDKDGASHVFINASKPETNVFTHEMGHANHHRGHDSFWEAKGVLKHDFADKQLEILGKDMRIYRGAGNFYNIFHFNPFENQTKFAIPNQDMETRFVYIKDILNKMQTETDCYAPNSISEQVAYVFDGLVRGKPFSDEVMLYYDFAGGARIPNLKIHNKTYDEYIESLYNNSDLIQKLRQNITISKL